MDLNIQIIIGGLKFFRMFIFITSKKNLTRFFKQSEVEDKKANKEITSN